MHRNVIAITCVAAVGLGVVAGLSANTATSANAGERFSHQDNPHLTPLGNAEIAGLVDMLEDVRLGETTHLDALNMTPKTALEHGLAIAADTAADITLRRYAMSLFAEVMKSDALVSSQRDSVLQMFVTVLNDSADSPRARLCAIRCVQEIGLANDQPYADAIHATDTDVNVIAFRADLLSGT